MINLLVVTHSRSGSTERLVRAFLAGVGDADAALEGTGTVDVRLRGCFEAEPADVLEADGIVLATPANFGYMSGAMKDFFERIYHPCLDQTGGRPYVLLVKGDTDTGGATTSVERIVAGLGWKAVLPPLSVVGTLEEFHLAAAREMGATLAAGLSTGML